MWWLSSAVPDAEPSPAGGLRARYDARIGVADHADQVKEKTLGTRRIDF